MKEKLSVEKASNGDWIVKAIGGKGQVASVFQSKPQAVLYARENADGREVVIHTSAGQVIRRPEVKTSKPAKVMRNAVLKAMQTK